ncbi:MAG TPA: hypothetical protein VGC84_01725 [Ilumatobacteraceae bacterium]|jgi:hypothetical protein
MNDNISVPERDFDFWVGEWDVHRSDTGELVGRNVITLLHGGRVLAERYTTLTGGFSGSSLNGFDSERGRWHQCWMDSAGLVLDIYGGLVDGDMVMQGESQSGQSERIAWTPLADGSVRQHWQQSTDHGANWLTVFDGTYRRRPSQVADGALIE